MSNYYYIVASLPMLIFNRDAGITVDEFLSICKSGLSEVDYLSIEELTKSEPCVDRVTPLARKFLIWNYNLMNSLAVLRAADKKVDSNVYLRDVELVTGVSDIVDSAMKIDSPLEAEIFLDNQRWSFIDTIKVGHMFDMDALSAYYFQLAISERVSNFDVEKGVLKYREVYHNIVKQDNDMNGDFYE